jgi:hypothetical protein
MIRPKERAVARKTWIYSLIKGNFNKSEGWNPAYVEHEGEKYSRVSLLATVVAKFLTEDGNYASVTLDDGTETIRLKAFGPDVAKLRDVSIGNVVRCIGKMRMYNEEIYIAPEILRPIDDPNWLLLHKLQLGTPNGMPKPAEVKPQVPEQVAVESIKEEVVNVRKTVIDIIRELDAGMGSDMNQVIEKSGLDAEEARNVLFSLLKAGDIYEPRKGRLKILD